MIDRSTDRVTPIRVLVIDDSPDITEMLSYLIGVEPDLECVGCLHSANDLLENVQSLRPDVLILDASMPGKAPLTALEECATAFPSLLAIVYSGYDDPSLVERVIDAGAWGFVSKREDPDSVVRAIRTVAAGKVAFPDSRLRSAAADPKQER